MKIWWWLLVITASQNSDLAQHDDVIKWKHFLRYWPFVRGIHRYPVNSPLKGQWRRALMFSLICTWIKSWVHNHEAGDWRCHRVHYDVTVMSYVSVLHPMIFGTMLSHNLPSVSTNINKELKNIQIWLEINKLSLNVKKTKFMIFHHKQRNIENLILQLNLNEQIIERVTDFDFLGLTIDQHLTWNGHVQKISNKISRSLGIMCKLKRFLPQNILQYCILSWGFKSDRIFKLQKKSCSNYYMQ